MARTNLKRCLASSIFLIWMFLLFPKVIFAIDDPHISWKDLESEHFIIHFPENREFFARRALSIAEEAHKALVPHLKWTPSTKTHLSVTDNLDVANGWARSVPQNEIRLYAYPPDISDELGFYDDWMRQLIYHEYTHILHTDTSYGLHPVLNAIFGKFARNNAGTPSWLTEGIAVYYESRLSNSGRLRNTQYRTMLMNAARKHSIPTLGEMSGGLRRWPGEAGHYLFGAFFIQYIAEHYGAESLTQWIHEYGDDWIPYAMNRAAIRIWGKTWDDLYSEWLDSIYSSELSISDETPHSSILKPWRHQKPEIHDNQLTYVKMDGFHRSALVEYDLNSAQEKVLADCSGNCFHHWNSDHSILYFTYSLVHDGFQQFETIYALNTKTNKIKHLNISGRIRTFNIEKDNIYWVEQENESTKLYQSNLSNPSAPKLLYQSLPFEQIDNIAIKNGQIAASIFSPQSQQIDLYLFENQSWRQLTNDKSSEITPFWMHDGRLGYVSDHDGFLNLWAIQPDGSEPVQLTTLVDGMLHPVESSNGDIFYTQYTADGTTIARIDHTDLKEISYQSLPSSLEVSYQDLKDVSISPLRSYRPWEWLWPHNWYPNYSWSETTKTAIGLSFNGSDLIDHHEYSVSFNYLTGKDAVSFDISYAWTALIWNILFSAGIEQLTSSYRDNQKVKYFDYQELYGDISAQRIWNGRSWTQSLTLEYLLEYLEPNAPISWSKKDPSAMPPKLPAMGWQNGLSARWGFSTMQQTERAYTYNAGYLVNATMRLEAPWLGADNYTFIGIFNAQAAWTMPFKETQVFSLHAAGGFSWSDNEKRTPFSLSSAKGFYVEASDVMIHGYPSGLINGKHYLYAHANYTAGIYDAELGHSTLPIGIQKIGLNLLADWGYAWDTSFDILHSKYAVGGDIFLDLMLGYRLPFRLKFGYAWGGAPGGGNQFYILGSLLE